MLKFPFGKKQIHPINNKYTVPWDVPARGIFFVYSKFRTPHRKHCRLQTMFER